MMLTRRDALLFLSLLAAGAPFAKAANADRPKNVILVTGGDYMRYRRILEATVAGLEALGLVRDMPHVPDSDREGTSDIWEALTRATGAMRFLPDGHYSYAWDKAVREKVNAEIAERLRTRRDVDLIFTFGTERGSTFRNSRPGFRFSRSGVRTRCKPGSSPPKPIRGATTSMRSCGAIPTERR